MHKRNKKEQGIVSFIVTLVMMLVISLIVIGFTQVTNRAQREALDRQLATQAQYAAESGVNKVKAIIDNAAIAGSKMKQSCANNGVYTAANFNPVVDSTNNVSVTCVLVDTRPKDIKISAEPTSSHIIPINPVDASGAAQSISTLTLTWSAATGQSTNASDCAAFNSAFPTSAGSCGFALLRMDVLPDVGAPNSDSLVNAQRTYYIKPVSAVGGAVDYTQKGVVVPANCTSNSVCTATVSLPNSGTKFYARLSTLYRAAPTVIIDSGVNTYFEGAQAIIDSTGKAQDVLKRIQVRYPLGDTVAEAPYAIQSDSTVCKQYTVGNGLFSNSCQ